MSTPAGCRPKEGTGDDTKGKTSESGSATPRVPPYTRKISLSRLAVAILNFGLDKETRQPSKLKEEELLQAAEAGDVQKVRRFFRQEGDVSVNCTDPLGRTPLQLAVANEHKEIVVILLDQVDKRSVYQALLLAVNLGYDELSELIIDHYKYAEISEEIKKQGRIPFLLNSFYDEMITPLVLAAQLNRYEVVTALLMKGEIIEKPHKFHCACLDCDRMNKCDELKFANARLNTFKGLASEAYISLSSEDPVLTSFELRRELGQVAVDEKYYTAHYNELAGRLSDYVVKLLDKVHGTEELDTILSAGDDTQDDAFCTLARLQLAIKYKEKKFVAHPSCQKKLTSLWYAEFKSFLKTRSKAAWICLIIFIMIFYPVLGILYLLVPKSKIAQLLRTPCVKFLAQALSFSAFLCLILTHSIVEQNKLCSSNLTGDRTIRRHWMELKRNLSNQTDTVAEMCVRVHEPALMELVVILWLTGLLWRECKAVHDNGPSAHFRNIYNSMDFFMLKFYIASMVLRNLTYVMVLESLDYFRLRDSWIKLIRQDREALYRLYWLNADRFYWDAWDPYYVCEALFAVGNIINFARMFQLLAISEHLGPMLISLERMIKDVMKFMSTFVPIFMAFMVGLYNMYWYYEPSVRRNVEKVDHKIETKAEKGFGTLEFSFRTIFWALFGLSARDTVELTQGYDSRFTESAGYIVFGVYHWASVIVLLNMLIAMMTRSFEKIATDQDIEWKFARSQLYLQYITGSTLPVPFNLIPSPKLLIRACKHMCLSLCSICRPTNRARRDNQLRQKYSMNGGLSLLIGSHYSGECDSEPGFLKQKVKPRKLKKLSSKFSSNLRTDWLGTSSGDCGDYKSVVKRVVRRYISEHLQASTVSNEGPGYSPDTDNVKRQLETVMEELNNVQTHVDKEMNSTKQEIKATQATLQILVDKMEGLSQILLASSHLSDRRPSDISMASSPTIQTWNSITALNNICEQGSEERTRESDSVSSGSSNTNASETFTYRF